MFWKNILFYALALFTLLLTFNFFGKAYYQMDRYAEFNNRSTIVYSGYKDLASQLNKAAVVNPGLLHAAGSSPAKSLFFADSVSVIYQLDNLKSQVHDSVNIQIVAQLDLPVRQELSWILRSNVPDSIVQHKAASHIKAYITIDSLLKAGAVRTGFLVDLHKKQLTESIKQLAIWMFAFIALSIIILTVAGFILLRQKSNLIIKERELEKSENRFRALVENNEDIIVLLNKDLTAVYRSPSATRYVGWSGDERANPVPLAYTHPDDVAMVSTAAKSVLAKPAEVVHLAFRTEKKTGGYAWLEGSVVNMLHDPALRGLIANFRDVTDRRLVEDSLAKSAKELADYRFALDESAIVAVTDSKGIITHANNNFCKISGYSKQELIGKDHKIINSGYHSKEFMRSIWKNITVGKIWQGEIKNRAKDGTFYWVDTSIVPFLNEGGKPYQYVAIRADITAQKAHEQSLLKANRLYSFISAINQSIVHINNQDELFARVCHIARDLGKFELTWIGLLDADKKLSIAAMAGSDGALLGLTNQAYLDFANGFMRDTPMAKAIAQGQYAVSNKTLEDASLLAAREWFTRVGIKSLIVFPLKKMGKVVGTICFKANEEDFFDQREINLLQEASGDISFALEVFEKEKLRTQAEASIARNEARLKKAQSIAHIGHWELNLATEQCEMSEEACRIYGLSPHRNIYTIDYWMSFMHPDDLPRVTRLAEEQNVTLNNLAYNCRIIRSDGTIRHLHTESIYQYGSDGKPKGLYGIIHDITDRVIAEETIRTSEANLTAIIENTDAYIYSLDTDLRYLRFNNLLKDVIQLTFGVEIKQGDSVLNFLGSTEQADEWGVVYKEAFTGKSMQFVREFNFGDTRTFTHFSINPIRADDKVIGLSCFARDITPQKLAEQQIILLNESLEAKVKERTAELLQVNQELETFSYTVSHDLPAPLRLLMGFTRLLDTNYSNILDEQGKEFLTIISKNASNMSELIRDLLRFSKLGKETLAIKEVSMFDLASIAINDVRSDPANSHVELNLLDLKPCHCDSGLIRQVWSNLINNAVKYSSKREFPKVEIGMCNINEQSTYYVKDNGTGFDMKHADKLFGVFQRLHQATEFEGTGVGLATVHRIIARHGGRIWAESTVDQGATFYFTIPDSSQV